jgi:uncharacterized protein (TIGR02594 family)
MPEKPPWLIKAESYEGVSEHGDMSDIQKWILETDGNPHREAWCADFANHCMETTGYAGTKSPAAASFLDWGKDIGDSPELGCLVVFQWSSGPDAGGHHVCFYVGAVDDDTIICLGGNQGRMVRRSRFPVSDVLSYRLPA